MLDRGALTDLILVQLRKTGIPIGDHIAPEEGGWSEGQPNVGTFTAYSVLSSGSVSITPNSLDTGRFDMRAMYSLRTFGVLRKQTDDVAHQVRTAFQFTPKQSISGHVPRLFWCNAIGALERITSNDPATWRISDSFTVECFAR